MIKYDTAYRDTMDDLKRELYYQIDKTDSKLQTLISKNEDEIQNLADKVTNDEYYIETLLREVRMLKTSVIWEAIFIGLLILLSVGAFLV